MRRRRALQTPRRSVPYTMPPAQCPPSSARLPTAWRCVLPVVARGALLAVRLAPHDAARLKGKKALRLTGYD